MNTNTGSIQQQLLQIFVNLGGQVNPGQNSNSFSTQGWLAKIAELTENSITSVGLSVPTGFAVSGSPVTGGEGDLTLAFDTGYSLPTTASQTNWNTAFGWGDHAAAGYLLASTASTIYQPLDGDLTAIGGLIGTAGLLRKTAANTWTLDTTAYTGTVTSVGLAVPTGFSVSGSPVTGSGDLTLGFAAGYALPTTAKQANWDTAFGWGNHATAGYETTTQLNARDTANRDRANHTGTQLAATISDIGTTISANTDVAANTAARHAAVTVTNSSEIDFTLTGQNITASLVDGSIGATRLSAGVNTSLGLANTALQPSTIGVTVQGYSAILAGITTQKITNWDTAFGWGNHASAGYLLSSTAASTYQPLDADLTAIAALAGTSGLLRKTAANTWTLDTTQAPQANLPYWPLGSAITTANNGTDATNDIDFVANGKAVQCRDVSGNMLWVTPAAGTVTKRADAAWASGTNAGGLGSGVSFTANTEYYLFLITNGTSIDYGFDTSITAANLRTSTGWAYYRPVGWLKTAGTAAWRTFRRDGVWHWWRNQDAATSTIGGAVATVNVDAPTGFDCLTHFAVSSGHASPSGLYPSFWMGPVSDANPTALRLTYAVSSTHPLALTSSYYLASDVRVQRLDIQILVISGQVKTFGWLSESSRVTVAGDWLGAGAYPNYLVRGFSLENLING